MTYESAVKIANSATLLSGVPHKVVLWGNNEITVEVIGNGHKGETLYITEWP